MCLCGYAIWGLGFLIAAGVISIALGVVVQLLTIRRGETKIPILVAISVFLTMLFGCCGYWVYCETNFECARGIGDVYRIPIKYPYEIEAIDSLDEGCLGSWEESNSYIVCGITDYTRRLSILVGKTNMGCSTSEEWFAFNLDTGELTCYSSSRAFIDACKEFGFAGMPELKPINERFDAHFE